MTKVVYACPQEPLKDSKLEIVQNSSNGEEVFVWVKFNMHLEKMSLFGQFLLSIVYRPLSLFGVVG